MREQAGLGQPPKPQASPQHAAQAPNNLLVEIVHVFEIVEVVEVEVEVEASPQQAAQAPNNLLVNKNNLLVNNKARLG